MLSHKYVITSYSIHYTKLYEKRQAIQITSSVRFYLFKTVYNQCLNNLKHQKVERAYQQQCVIDSFDMQQSQWSLYNEYELRNVLDQAITKLPDKCREVFELSRFDNLKNKDVITSYSIHYTKLYE